ncbi:MAG: hypothetical protein H6712_25215 [Myxococcales bacterium]|nr:hypothetical protein [Myxococcales bacterium]MCB9717175.1 hypothetical protein [Myxococcales bacterium]
MRGRSKAMVVGLALGGVLGTASCGGGGAASPTERLWVSGVPTNPKDDLTAFLTMRTEEDRYLGAFFQGTLLRGGHDVFRWTPVGDERAQIEFLQDGKRVALRFETCKPSKGFDHCILVHGDPTGTQRYQSRKRWVVRRPGRKRDATVGMVTQAMLELAEDDAELSAALDAAAAVLEAPAEDEAR